MSALLQAGQSVGVRWRTAEALVLQNIQRLRLDPRTPTGTDASCWVTFVDAKGVSFYIARGAAHGGDMQAFMPEGAIQWKAYFEPHRSIHAGYVDKKHFARVFPRDFL